MNIVSENHADTFGNAVGQSRDGLFLAVIGEGLRENFHDTHAAVPEEMLALIRSLDRPAGEHGQFQGGEFA
jgi:hypothetical protein